MGHTTLLRKEIKDNFVPFAMQKGFEVDLRQMPRFMVFRRQQGECVHIFDIQWEKYGRPRFAVNFCSCPAEGVQINGAHYKPEDVSTGWAQIKPAGFLKPNRALFSGSWFRQDPHFALHLLGRRRWRTPQEVVGDLKNLFPELEKYWCSGNLGAHMRLWPR